MEASEIQWEHMALAEAHLDASGWATDRLSLLLPPIGPRVVPGIVPTVRPQARLDGRRLAEVRSQMHLSQSAFADEINFAAHELGYLTRCTKRLVQKWEKGVHARPSRCYQVAIGRVTGFPFESFMKYDDRSQSPTMSRAVNDIAILLAFLVKRLDDLAAELRFAEFPDPGVNIHRDRGPSVCM